MATNPAHVETEKTARTKAADAKRAFTPIRVLIGAICTAIVLLMLGAIAHVAQEQVRKGMNLHEQVRHAPHSVASHADADS